MTYDPLLTTPWRKTLIIGKQTSIAATSAAIEFAKFETLSFDHRSEPVLVHSRAFPLVEHPLGDSDVLSIATARNEARS